jgi:hypothetical protein
MHFLNVYMAFCSCALPKPDWVIGLQVQLLTLTMTGLTRTVADLHPSMAVTLYTSELAGKATL